jgi:AcrR family transcriptional regulator
MTDKPRDPTVSVWVAPPKHPKRGSAPVGLSRERIVRTAVALLDAEGVQAFTMRKLATELDVTPMSVYWYVNNKDELLELALDDAFGQMRLPSPQEHDDWRPHLRTLANESRRCFQEHPWAGQLAGQFLALGPNSLLFSTSAVSAVARTGLPTDQLSAALSLIFDYTYGVALLDARWNQQVRASGQSEDEFYQVVYGVLGQADTRFVENAEVIQHSPDGDFAEARDRRFAQGLDLALAGIEATIAAARPAEQVG